MKLDKIKIDTNVSTKKTKQLFVVKAGFNSEIVQILTL